MIRQTLLIALPLALAACGQSETTPEPEASETSAVSIEDRLVDARLMVDANGLSARGSEGLKFGATREEVDAFAGKAFEGEPTRSRNEECGAGPMDFSEFGPLQIAYLDGKFAGWFLRAGDGVVTSDGIRPGATLDALKDERQVRELDTTLPGEFEYTAADYGTITGFAEDGELVSGLQAGISCFFR